MRTASTGAFALAVFALAIPIHASAQSFCRSVDARGNVTYSDCRPATTYRPDGSESLEQQAPGLKPSPSVQPSPAAPTPSPTVPTLPPARSGPTAAPAPRALGERAQPPVGVPVVPPPIGHQPVAASQPSAAPGPGMRPQTTLTLPPSGTPPSGTLPPSGTPPSSVMLPPSGTPPSSTTWQASLASRPTLGIARSNRRLLTASGKRSFLIGLPFIVLGFVVNLVATFQYMRRAFNVSVWWGLGCLFVGPINLLFLVLHWSLVKKPFVVSLLGVGLILVGVVVVKVL